MGTIGWWVMGWALAYGDGNGTDLFGTTGRPGLALGPDFCGLWVIHIFFLKKTGAILRYIEMKSREGLLDRLGTCDVDGP